MEVTTTMATPATTQVSGIGELLQLQGSARQAARIAIKVNGRILFLDLGNVLALQAEGNYVLLLEEVASYLLRQAISVMAEKLEPYGFIRIHRSVVVNGSLVEELRPDLTGAYRLRLRGGKQYTVTRN